MFCPSCGTLSSDDWVAAFISDTYASILTSAVMIPVNIVYLKKRKHLFVNRSITGGTL